MLQSNTIAGRESIVAYRCVKLNHLKVWRRNGVVLTDELFEEQIDPECTYSCKRTKDSKLLVSKASRRCHNGSLKNNYAYSKYIRH